MASADSLSTRQANKLLGGGPLGRTPVVSWMNRLGLRPSLFYYLLAALLIVLVLYPFFILVMASFFTGQPGRLGSFTLNGYRVWLEAGEIIPILLNSVIFSGSRLFIGLVFGLLFAWAVARTNVPFASVMMWLIPMPFFIPDLLTGISWLMLGNPQNGLINQWARDWFGVSGTVIDLYGWGGLIFHASLNTISFLFLMMVGFFKTMDSSYEEAARTLGAGNGKVLFTITLPMLAPAILSISILIFVHGLESFENPLLFGNPGGVYVFANEIYRMLSYRHPPQYGAATALSVIVIFTMIALLALKAKFLGERSFTVITGKGYRPTQMKLGPVARWSIFAVFVIYFMLAVVVPIAQIIVSSFFQIFGMYDPEHFTFKNWTDIMRDERAMTGLKNTLLYSTLAGIATVVIGGLVGYIRVRTRHWLGRYLELLAWAPWTLPGVVMGLALLWAWALPPQPFNLYGTSLVIIMGFIIKGLPLGTATMQSAIRQVSGELEESSRVHGGSWLQTVRHILGPLLSRGAMATFVIVFAMAARDLTIPLFLYTGGTETLTVALLKFYEEGSMGVLSAIAVIQLGMVMSLLCLERLVRGKENK